MLGAEQRPFFRSRAEKSKISYSARQSASARNAFLPVFNIPYPHLAGDPFHDDARYQ